MSIVTVKHMTRSHRHNRHQPSQENRKNEKSELVALQVMPTTKNSEHRFCIAIAAIKTGGNLPKGAYCPCNPEKRRRKERNFMRQRTVAINIRVTESEKRKLERAAKKCGLSLSAYLRKLGLGKEMQTVSPQSFYEAYRQLTLLKDTWKTTSREVVDRNFALLTESFLKVYHELNGKEEGKENQWQ